MTGLTVTGANRMDGDVPDHAVLYSIDDLMGEWSSDDPLSYAATLDSRTFLAAATGGLRVPHSAEVAQARAIHDYRITRALNNAVADRNVVAVMGGHQLRRDAPAYELVARIAWRLASQDYLIISGGGPGAMEASHLGTRFANIEIGDLEAALTEVCKVPAFPEYKMEELVADGRFDETLLAALHAWQVPAFRVAREMSGAAQPQ